MKSIAFADNQNKKFRRNENFQHSPRDVADPMTPEQYYDLNSRVHHLEGESRLLFAVLEDAVRCYTNAARSGRRSHQRELDEVKEWVNTRGDRDLFSFESICRVFDLEPERLRHQLNLLENVNIGRRRFRTVGRRIAIRAFD